MTNPRGRLSAQGKATNAGAAWDGERSAAVWQLCLAVLDDVAEARTEVIITKRGRPVAQLVPIATAEEREKEILAGLRGQGKITVSEDEFLRPSSGDAAWAALADRIGIPTIAFWEVALLARKGKLALQMAVAEWAHRLLDIPRVEALPLTAAIALRADSLAMHSDPPDRVIVATAIEEGAHLVSKDRLLRDLKSVKTVW